MISPMQDAPTLSRANTLIWYFCSLSWVMFPFQIHSCFLPPIPPMYPPYHFHSPYVLQSVFKPLSSFHAHSLCVGIGLSTLVQVTYQDPSSWRKLISLPQCLWWANSSYLGVRVFMDPFLFVLEFFSDVILCRSCPMSCHVHKTGPQSFCRASDS